MNFIETLTRLIETSGCTVGAYFYGRFGVTFNPAATELFFTVKTGDSHKLAELLRVNGIPAKARYSMIHVKTPNAK